MRKEELCKSKIPTKLYLEKYLLVFEAQRDVLWEFMLTEMIKRYLLYISE